MSQHNRDDPTEAERQKRKAAAREALLENPSRANRGGFSVEEWVRIGIFHSPSFVSMLCRRLHTEGIRFRLEFTRFDATISVPREDRGKAFAILDHQMKMEPASTPNLRRQYDVHIVLGMTLMLLIAAVGMQSAYHGILLALVVGVAVARVDRHLVASRWRGTMDLGLADLLAGFIILGAIFAAFK